jgi:ADP-ribosyl-[dinitrogen reductase] hydrolase
VDAHAAAAEFDQWLRSKPVDVGQTVRRGIVHYRRSGQPEVAQSETDAGNGACMRTLPVALATLGCSRREIEQASATQAHITHNNPLSDAACVCVIDMVHGALYGADKRELISGPIADLVERFPEFTYRPRRMENPTGYIVDTMIAVLQAFIDTDSFRDCLVEVVNRGGDADTTGAIAGMIAGAYYGLHAIPREWLAALDSRARDACRDQALALMDIRDLQVDEASGLTAVMMEMKI